MEGGFDNDLALSDDGRYFRRRDWCIDAAVCDGVAYSRWQAWPDVDVRTWLIAGDAWHVRLHRMTSGRQLRSFEGGFAVGLTERIPLPTPTDPIPTLRLPRGASALRDLSPIRRTPGGIDLGPNSSLMTSLLAMPTLTGAHEPGTV
jgi:hypothetical protein